MLLARLSTLARASPAAGVLRSAAAAAPAPLRAVPFAPVVAARGARGVCFSIPVSGPGGADKPELSEEQMAISAKMMAQMEGKISEALEAQSVKVTDAYGDYQHVSIDVVSEQFEGKNSMQRQRLVYKAIWLELQNHVHAVDAMTTKTPAEAAS